MTGEPAPRRNWWKFLLIASLALNLLFAGAIVARFFVHDRMERMASISYLQLLPRKFFAGLDRQRRDELIAVLKPYRDKFRDGQQNARTLAEGLADALAAMPYDEARMRAVVGEFGNNGSGLIGLGSQATLEFVAKLSPEERQRLAQLIRERATVRRRQ